MIKNMKLLRTEMGVSQQQVADVIGVSQQSINKYENHKIEPDIATLIRLADYFHTSVDYLIGHTTVRHIIEPVQRYDLNSQEADMLESYRRLTDKQKEMLQLLAEAFLE